MKRLLIFLFVATMMLPAIAQEQREWAMLTNTGESVKIEQVDYLLAADDLPLFSIILKGGSTIDGVSQVTFSDVTSVNTVEVREQISLFPNPVQEYLNITGCTPGCDIYIVSIDGKVVLTHHVNGDNATISVADLQKGYYLLQTPHSTLKFIKK
ncbi:MAG: T9SS type A sorting domain-containing protein [Bacteroidaceae bacterium]|nr:T9SS type A sorting domain-containing protein [Bacteroidaceae bacterium]